MRKRTLLALIFVPAILFGINSQNPQMTNEVNAAYTPYQIPNGGFETGNLSGWNVFRLWKDEPGMAAFDESLVHDKTYFGSNPYGKDGTYQLGITSEANQYTGTIQWDQAAERMGYLRSADFILGGSGWISFKLGGGKHPSFAYMSVRETSTDIEVARFANRHFNDTDKATTQYGTEITNAEAFLFQYYYDLDLVADLGDSLYILLSDTAAYDWSILSADSFVTYIADEPTPSADQTAENILPTISGISTATNAIVNGYFNTDLSGWDLSNDSSNGWYYHGDHYPRSNSDGDSSIGILRSSAFTVSTDKYIRFDWAGGLKYDKQIFISVKETSTNIEKLRYVRRDNLSSKESESFDNHMLNLSSLDGAKTYYLEFADARSGGWGISYFDAIRIVPESEWNSVTSGDRAVSISNLPLSFSVNYVQEAASYGAYFIEQTAAQCAALQGDTVPWTTLETEYNTLSNDAKDYFVNSSTTEPNVVAARDRFVFLYNKYGAGESWNYFLEDSLDNPYNPAPMATPPLEISSSNLYILIFTGSLFLLSALGYFYTRKRQA